MDAWTSRTENPVDVQVSGAAALPASASHPLLGPEVQRLVRGVVARLLRSGWFDLQERHDLQQELVLALLTRWPTFAPQRGTIGAFATVVARTKAANLLRDRIARWRRSKRLGKPGRAARLGRQRHLGSSRAAVAATPDRDRRDLHLDVVAVLGTLPATLVAFAQQLGAHPPAAAARAVGFTRHGLRTALRDLARHFRALR